MTAGEDIAIRRKRLRYRAWHRGTKEMDLILGPFADAHVESYGAAELDRLEALMDEEDPPL
ncbi:MAG: succinate dehydrogenase assembly factor 2, partial [Phyllobacteriaceae bacterium]|nr:succinate dehydrogenase assembly factor 2 [Phyllobacteriaceae bacterium]